MCVCVCGDVCCAVLGSLWVPVHRIVHLLLCPCPRGVGVVSVFDEGPPSMFSLPWKVKRGEILNKSFFFGMHKMWKSWIILTICGICWFV